MPRLSNARAREVPDAGDHDLAGERTSLAREQRDGGGDLRGADLVGNVLREDVAEAKGGEHHWPFQ
jgi:hypothetical protein